jgi:ribonuclease HII
MSPPFAHLKRNGGDRHSLGPTLYFERRAWAAGHEIVAGVDEAGRGAWAGPLVAAAAVVPREGRERGRLTRALRRGDLTIDDSKRLSPASRRAIDQTIGELGFQTAVAVISVDEIDRTGVGVANRRALAIAAERLSPSPGYLLVDAFDPIDPPCGWEAIIHGDALSMAVALASIVAKVHRDALMEQLDAACPGYGFAVHKGYGTAAHRHALGTLGISHHHRRTFAPIARFIDDRVEQR